MLCLYLSVISKSSFSSAAQPSMQEAGGEAHQLFEECQCPGIRTGRNGGAAGVTLPSAMLTWHGRQIEGRNWSNWENERQAW